MGITQYLKDVKAEGERVSWPSRRTATVLTIVVVAISLVVAAYLGLLDFIFTRVLQNIL